MESGFCFQSIKTRFDLVKNNYKLLVFDNLIIILDIAAALTKFFPKSHTLIQGDGKLHHKIELLPYLLCFLISMVVGNL